MALSPQANHEEGVDVLGLETLLVQRAADRLAVDSCLLAALQCDVVSLGQRARYLGRHEGADAGQLVQAQVLPALRTLDVVLRCLRELSQHLLRLVSVRLG